MADPYLGGIVITSVIWDEPSVLRVDFTSTHSVSTYKHQLYIGRQLVGVTDNSADRILFGTFTDFGIPEEVTVVAVDAAEHLTDYGDDLPSRPYARAKLTIVTSGWGSDKTTIEVSAGTEPGGAVESENIVAIETFVANGTYTIITQPMDASVEWNYEVVGRDGILPTGNRGTAVDISVDLLVYPQDVVSSETGPRLVLTTDSGNLIASFTEDE